MKESTGVHLQELKLSYKIQFDTIDNNLTNAVTLLQEKITKDIQTVYCEMFKQIRNVQIGSLETVKLFLRLSFIF